MMCILCSNIYDRKRSKELIIQKSLVYIYIVNRFLEYK